MIGQSLSQEQNDWHDWNGELNWQPTDYMTTPLTTAKVAPVMKELLPFCSSFENEWSHTSFQYITGSVSPWNVGCECLG